MISYVFLFLILLFKTSYEQNLLSLFIILNKVEFIYTTVTIISLW